LPTTLVKQDRVRGQLRGDARSCLEIAFYDETIRFNIVLVGDGLCIVPPCLPAMRGIDSPTFVAQRKWGACPLARRTLTGLMPGCVLSPAARARPVVRNARGP
jgi:hypothetical protein